jgi:membrane protease YdiL (CAAX protease family)
MTEILGLVTIFLPLLAVMWLANLAQAQREKEQPNTGAAIAAYILVAAIYGLGVVVGLGLQAMAMLLQMQPGALETLPAELPVASFALLAVGIWLPSLVGLVLLLPPVRRLAAAFAPLDPNNPVHGIALSLTMMVVINLLITLGIGLDNLTELMMTTQGAGAASVPVLWVQQVLTAVLALVGVGWTTRRSFGAALARLGLVWPTGRQWLIGVAAGLVMVPVVILLEYAGSTVGIGASPDVERLTEQLLGALIGSPLGILTLGLSAALGEETLFRGALTPRFGVLWSSLLFALVHSNYGITFSTLVVLLLGLVLAFLRNRHNTSTAMITHAVYNISLGVLASLSASFLDF